MVNQAKDKADKKAAAKYLEPLKDQAKEDLNLPQDSHVIDDKVYTTQKLKKNILQEIMYGENKFLSKEFWKMLSV